MTPAERLKERMRLMLEKTQARDTQETKQK